MKNRIPAEEIKNIEVSILDFINEICEENKIHYYLAYGTLLGAIRHQGFIPWDDDIDIYMLREDYTRFIQILRNKQDNRYQLISMYNDRNYTYEFAKVVDNRTVLTVNNINHSTKEGVWVDIFPLDMGAKKIRVQKVLINMAVACRILSVYQRFPYQKRSIAFYPVWLFSRLIGHRFFLRIINRLSQMGKNGEIVGYMASMGVSRYYFPKKWCDNICMVEFEGKRYPAFEHYDDYLKYQYGNYMQLPPVEKRLSHPVEAYWR